MRLVVAEQHSRTVGGLGCFAGELDGLEHPVFENLGLVCSRCRRLDGQRDPFERYRQPAKEI